MLVDPKLLVRRLSPLATRALEASVHLGSTSGHPEVGPEHLLVALLELDEGDIALLSRRLDIDRSAALHELRASLRASDSSSRRRPVFAESLFRWLEDAWAPASLEFGSVTLRTSHLLLQLLTSPQRYLPELPRALAVIRAPELRQHLPEWTAASPERADADPDPTAPRGPAPTNGDASELSRFTHSLTDAARSGAIDPICGRDAEIYQLIEVLARRRKNNPVIVGEPGVGKTALVEGLALAIARGDVPPALTGVDLRTLDLGLLQAGAGVRGEFERRLRAVIDAVRASPTPIVLFIDEAHTLISPSHDHDAANLLKPALARGELRTIAATTWREFKKYFEKDPALERRFQPVRVDEPTLDAAAAMLRNVRGAYEKAHGVLILDAAIDAAVQLSHRYIQSRLLPDKAIDVLDTAAARVQLEQSARPAALAALEQQLAAVDRQIAAHQREDREGYPVDHDQQSALARTRADLADRATMLAARWQTERDALSAIQAARAAADGDPSAAEALRRARARMRELAGTTPLVHAEVDADAIARVVATMSGVPVERLHRSTVDALLRLEGTLAERIKGQPHALQAISEALRVARAGIQAPERPLGVFLFVGTSGVGKTETALALAELIFGGEQSLVTINMSEFQASHTTSRLVGSPPGYVGYGEGGTLTEAVRKRPYSVVLLDECEKAHLDVLNLFYQVFDKGTLADGEGRAVDFRNTIIILTSNLASDELLALASRGATPSEAAAAIHPLLAAHFRPALLARMTVIPFMPLDRTTMREIAELKLGALARRIHAQHDITATFAPALLDRLVDRCATVDAGARELDHILRASLMPRLGAALLTELIDGTPRHALTVDLAGDGEWRLEFC